ncbi:MAG TPA: hypothetical protein V6C65_15575, partial [Allocoleopsis sp.]
TFVEHLQTEVATYLSLLATLRQERAEAVEEMLKQARTTRAAEMKSLFNHLFEFRSELQQFHTELHQSVFGMAMSGVEHPQKEAEAKTEENPVQNMAMSFLDLLLK